MVPPGQAERMRDALDAAGVRCDLRFFEGEGHGFRRADTLTACLEAELAFYLGRAPPLDRWRPSRLHPVANAPPRSTRDTMPHDDASTTPWAGPVAAVARRGLEQVKRFRPEAGDALLYPAERARSRC